MSCESLPQMVQLTALPQPLRFLLLAMLMSGALQRRPRRLSEGWAGNITYERTWDSEEGQFGSDILVSRYLPGP